MMKAYQTLLAILLILIVQGVHSANYKWSKQYASMYGYTDSPTQSCLAMERDVAANAGYNHSAKFLYIKRSVSSAYSYDCYYQLYQYNAVNRTWSPSGSPTNRVGWYITSTRVGDSCPAGKVPVADQSSGSCSPPKGPPAALACKGNPINIASGNKYQEETDFKVSGYSHIEFKRFYNSVDGLWRHNYAAYLDMSDASVVKLVLADGRESHFSNNGTGLVGPSLELGKLEKINNQWLYSKATGERLAFDSTGKLMHWSNTHGVGHQLTYSEFQISVTDNLGNSLSFTEDSDHQPLTLTAPGVQITYVYNVNKRLTSITRVVDGQTTQRQFHYEDSRNNSWLTGITDERGVRYASWTYDGQGRATSSEHTGGADRVVVVYNTDGTVSVINELGRVTKYRFQYIKGVRHITSIQGEPSPGCPNSNSSFTYDDRGLFKTKTDNKGHLTTYNYNTRGLEASRTEAAGTPQARTITTEWHPTLFLRTKVTEPTRITTYTYDAQGRQLSQSVAQR